MYRLFVLWLGIFLAVLDPAEVAASTSAAPETALETQGIPRPRYRYYRHKAKARKAKRKARKQKKTNRGLFRRKPKGVITVDPPVRNN
ncbi:hypothetical protein [Hymenobacter jeollabukensis]|uniref:Uncharacterized protein n=1 Tax=Hymenobacter jeollabukensis TaxID=2025313 RepID=A0A5R8WIG8_9BACT|nr:hypothetical protein [Hymenobacter jeollabukensis]TLM87892.1 hypothetical protein FDY95_24940 [Hymenobacter jeollabukensis]